MINPGERVVVSGFGAVTPYGAGVDRLWQSLQQGVSAISAMDLFDLGGIACTLAGIVRNYQPITAMPRASGFALGAAREALIHAGVADCTTELDQIALLTATNFGDIGNAEPALLPDHLEGFNLNDAVNASQTFALNRIADGLGIGGVRLALSLSCASGASAVATGASLIAAGHIKCALVVGYDAISRFSWSGLCSLRTMTRGKVRPFDKNRSGTLFSEGAAALLLESESHCAARGGKAQVFLSGWAVNNNGFHMTAPAEHGQGSWSVMNATLHKAGLKPQDVDHINAHGTATRANDITESQAINNLFGSYTNSIPVTSNKGGLGHMLGAAGTVEAIAAILSIREGAIPPTLNMQEQDPECELDVVTSLRKTRISTVLSNSAGFGGCNAALLFTLDPAETVEQHKTILPVISGIGVVSALGEGHLEHALALAEGESALDTPLPELCGVLSDGLKPQLVGMAPDPVLADYGITPKPYLDRTSALFLTACGMALQDAGAASANLQAGKAGVLCGTGWGCIATARLFFADYATKGARLVKPFLFPHAYPNTAVSLAAIEWQLCGVHECVCNLQTASGIALVTALDYLVSGQDDQLLLTGGAESLNTGVLYGRAAANFTSSAGEAGAVVVLESAENADQRGAAVIGRVLGWSLAAQPDRAVNQVCKRANIAVGQLELAVVNEQGADWVADHIPKLARLKLEELCGDVQGATTVLHLVCGLLSQISDPVLVLTTEPGCSVALIIQVSEQF